MSTSSGDLYPFVASDGAVADLTAGVGSQAVTSADGVRLVPDGAAETAARRSSYRNFRAALVVSDAFGVVASFVIAYAVLSRWAPSSSGGFLAVVPLAPLAIVGSFHAFGLYEVHRLSWFEEFRRLVGATSTGMGLVTIASAWRTSIVYRRGFALSWVIVLVVLLLLRRGWRSWLARSRATGRLAFRTVIVGAPAEASQLEVALRDPELGYRIVARLDPPGPLRPVGDDEFEDRLRQARADCVFVAPGAVTSGQMMRVMQCARRVGAEVRTSANLVDVLVSRVSILPFGDAISLSVKPLGMTRTQAAAKRGFDLMVAGLLLVVSLPVLAVVAAAVRLTSPGGAMFCQQRVTRSGRTFTMYKFRTMVPEQVRPRPPEVIDLTVPFFKLDYDPRLTRVGGLLRKTSLDELPQLWNVIRGDLSLVGPRPLPLPQVEANPELLGPRHEVRAGITGWWQINGRSSVEPSEAIRMDLFYIENWSLSLDLFIMMRTVGTVLMRTGAR